MKNTIMSSKKKRIITPKEMEKISKGAKDENASKLHKKEHDDHGGGH